MVSNFKSQSSYLFLLKWLILSQKKLKTGPDLMSILKSLDNSTCQTERMWSADLQNRLDL